MNSFSFSPITEKSVENGENLVENPTTENMGNEERVRLTEEMRPKSGINPENLTHAVQITGLNF